MMAEKIDGDMFRWILGGILGLFSMIGGFWLTNLTNAMTDLRRDVVQLGQEQSALKAHDESQTKLLDRVDQRFERIEQKIDLLLQERRSHP
jgi:hypothetical protein